MTTTAIYAVYYLEHLDHDEVRDMFPAGGVAGTYSSESVAYKVACAKQIEWLTVNCPSQLNTWLEDHPIPDVDDPVSIWRDYLLSIDPGSNGNLYGGIESTAFPECKAYYVEATVLDEFPSKPEKKTTFKDNSYEEEESDYNSTSSDDDDSAVVVDLSRTIPNFQNLTILNLTGMKLTQLPILPSNLVELYCSNNKLEELPTLPLTLVTNTQLR